MDRKPISAHLPRARRPRACRLGAALLVGALAFAAGLPARAADAGNAPGWSAGIEQQVRQFALDAGTPQGMRFEIVVGALDPRLKLAPCERVEPYLPAGTRLWGRTRIGLRCAQGPTPWNVYLPLTVKAFGPGLVAAAALPAGTVLGSADLQAAEVDLADGGMALVHAEAALGRTLNRALTPGQSLRQADLRSRQWFAAGDMVQIIAVGTGFKVSGEGQALGPGLEGQPARVRTESGRVIVGMPVAQRRIELSL